MAGPFASGKLPSTAAPAVPDDLAGATALELAAALRSRRTTAVAVTEATLGRIERDSTRVGAFVAVAAEQALREAAAADTVLDAAAASGGAGPQPPPLLGVPCPIKDLNAVAGMPYVAGSRAMLGNVADADDGVVRRLRDAGAIVVGKTATPEFGFPCYTESDVAPPARTPWDVGRSAGGSSGGAAAAVAAGLVSIAHGSDGGGSIRIPAAACGLVGLKASRGRISPGPLGIDGPGLASHGVLTRTVRDTAIGLDVLAQGWPGDVYRLPPPRTTYLDACDRPTGALRIGVLTEPIIADCEVAPGPLNAVERAIAVLRGLGHQVQPAPRPFPAARWEAFAAVWSVLALSIPLPPEAEPLLTPLTRWLRERGRAVTGAEYAAALAATQQLARETAAAWDDVDVILTPTLAQPPAPVGSLRDDADPAADFDAQCAFTPWTSTYNLTGRPAISLPLHRERSANDAVELPYGVMLGARLGEEETLLALAAAVEAADPWRDTLPRNPGALTAPHAGGAVRGRRPVLSTPSSRPRSGSCSRSSTRWPGR
ncbi:MAG: amidase [Austwickia sp.]|jgi:amidase|nr:MAG: amidase [Austwickia sp.]